MKMAELSIMLQKMQKFLTNVFVCMWENISDSLRSISMRKYFSLYLCQRRILNCSFDKSYPRSSSLIFFKKPEAPENPESYELMLCH